MSIRDWRTRHSLKDPVKGQFQVTGRYFAHPNGNSYREMLTGVITGPGIVTTAGEHLDDTSGRYIGHDVLPALIDRSDPTTFVILWDEIPKPDFRADARAQAEQAARAARAAQSFPGAQPVTQPIPASTFDATGGPVPSWASELVADLARQGVIPGVPGGDGMEPPITITMPDRVIDLTVGRVSAGEAASLMVTGEPATAVLVAIADVAVPQQALPGPTASLCDLAVRVTLSSGESYDAQTRLGFRDAHRRASIAVIGATLPVRIDASDRTRVVIDSATFDARHADLLNGPTSR